MVRPTSNRKSLKFNVEAAVNPSKKVDGTQRDFFSEKYLENEWKKKKVFR